MYAARTGAASGDKRSCAKLVILPLCFASAALKYSPTHLFTSVISGQWSLAGLLIVVSCVKPTPKLMSSGSCSTIISSAAGGIGGFSRSLSRASQEYAQPFLYFSAKAVESVSVFVREMTAVLRSSGLSSFCVSGRMMFK